MHKTIISNDAARQLKLYSHVLKIYCLDFRFTLETRGNKKLNYSELLAKQLRVDVRTVRKV